MKYFTKSLILLTTHLFAGRIISIPVGIALFGRWYIAVILILLFDFIQISFYFYLYESPDKVRFIAVRLRLIRIRLGKIIRRFRIPEERNVHAQLLKRARFLGQWGVLLISSIPFLGGGLWSGILLTHLLKIEKNRSYILLCSGSLVGATFVALGFGGIKAIFFALVDHLMVLMY